MKSPCYDQDAFKSVVKALPKRESTPSFLPLFYGPNDEGPEKAAD
jgi:hypothetical protein